MSRSSPKNPVKTPGCVVRPFAISEKSAIESVVDFFQDVIPNQSRQSDEREKILWVKMEQMDTFNIPNRSDQIQNSLVIIIGYATGAQVWLMQNSGEAHEVLSLRQSKVKIFTLLGRDRETGPLAAICDDDKRQDDYSSSSAKHHVKSAAFSHVKLVNVTDGRMLWQQWFSNTVNDIYANDRIFLVSVHRRIAAFYIHNQQIAFTILGCFPTDGANMNPLAFGSTWLAYSSAKLVNHLKSRGEVLGESQLSYTATALNTAKNVTSSLASMVGYGTSSETRTRRDSGPAETDPPTSGVVTVVDAERLNGTFDLREQCTEDAVICHFKALTHRVAFLQFDKGGTLLFATDKEGQNFHIFKILPHMYDSSKAAVQHLYVMHRGDTSAVVQDVAFSIDSRWISVCTARGTTHVFPLNSYGGLPNARTHTSRHVVNKASKFHRSAGIDQVQETSGTMSSKTDLYYTTPHIFHGSLENSRHPTSPNTVTLHQPIVQIKQPLRLPSVSSAGQSIDRHIRGGNIAACFSSSKERRVRHGSGQKDIAVETLHIMCDNGTLVEYALNPQCDSDTEKITEDTALRLTVTMRAQWCLERFHQSMSVNLLLRSPTCRTTQARPRSLSDTIGAGLNTRYGSKESISSDTSTKSGDFDEPWLSQVEILTHVGPNRRLWMGPQFKFKVVQNNGAFLNSESPALFASDDGNPASDQICEDIDLSSLQVNQQTPSNPVPMPGRSRTYSMDQIYIEAGSFEQSPQFLRDHLGLFDPLGDVTTPSCGQREGLTEAMREAMGGMITNL